MSHGHVDSGIRAEPNLVPLLDLVLQLLMFFILTVNFVTQQVNEDIQLPVMQSARPMDRRETDVLYLNLNAEGSLEVPGRPVPLKAGAETRVYLRGEYEDAKRLALARTKSDKVHTVVIIRADKAVDYKSLYDLLEACKTVGYQKYQIRALTRGESTPVAHRD
jgi:biopolymer transport protein ExbD